MDQQMKILVEIENNPFTSATHGHHLEAGKLLLPRFLPSPPQTLMAHLNGGEAPVNELGPQFTNDRLDFR